ncbi:MAG: putative DNA binding domain-containing protein, partial [Clostridia bacterium]|nr:putative DNA binding domain-containing protein [Clostridia bacterium]
NQKIVETMRIEYKENWNPEPILHTICAFANDFDNLGGGYIIIGVKEKNGAPEFPVVGIAEEDIDKINKDVLQKCNLIEPGYVPVCETCIYDGKNIIVLWVPGGEARPYSCPIHVYGKETKSERTYYIRKSSNSIQANQSEIKELFQQSETIPFDDRMNMHADISDLKKELMADFLKTVNSDLYTEISSRTAEELATDMRIIAGPTEIRKPLNVGLMFFNERPDNFFRYARIEIVDKPDATGIGMTEKIFFGPLYIQLLNALSYIQSNIIAEKTIKKPDKAESERFYNYPYSAVEEALCNAVHHKSYQIAEPVTVTVTPKEMEILSLPGPDRSISDEDIAKRRMVSTNYRNRRIGDFLRELHLVEGRNTGIPTILKAMKDNGSPLPTFKTDENRTYLRVILPVHKGFAKNTEFGTEGTKSRNDASKLRDEIIRLVREEKEISISEINKKLGYSKNSRSVYNMVKQLQSEGMIEYTQPDAVKSRTQKIRLTGK